MSSIRSRNCNAKYLITDGTAPSKKIKLAVVVIVQFNRTVSNRVTFVSYNFFTEKYVQFTTGIIAGIFLSFNNVPALSTIRCGVTLKNWRRIILLSHIIIIHNNGHDNNIHNHSPKSLQLYCHLCKIKNDLRLILAVSIHHFRKNTHQKMYVGDILVFQLRKN